MAILFLEPPVGASEGPATCEPLPEVDVPPAPPPLEDVPDPLIGPVEYLPVPVPPFGTGTVKGEDGFTTGLGVVGGFKDGRAVGGAGLACSALFGPAVAGVCEGFLAGAGV